MNLKLFIFRIKLKQNSTFSFHTVDLVLDETVFVYERSGTRSVTPVIKSDDQTGLKIDNIDGEKNI